jgi:hypothetical protein
MSMSIPAFHVSDASEVKGHGDVFIASRASAPASGVFSLEVAVQPTTTRHPMWLASPFTTTPAPVSPTAPAR